jgi:hypothetical protein
MEFGLQSRHGNWRGRAISQTTTCSVTTVDMCSHWLSLTKVVSFFVEGGKGGNWGPLSMPNALGKLKKLSGGG